MQLGDIDFLIIGATKSATTWLQRSLQSDDDVYMPDPELHYFSREYHRGVGWYLSQFGEPGPGRVVGEKSNSYLDEPPAAQRIHEALPHVKLIAQLRNPVDRAYSNYCMLYRRGEVGADIERYLDPADAVDLRILDGGHYSRHIRAYLDLYPRERLLVLIYEKLKLDPLDQLNAARRFLGLAPVPALPIAGKIKDKTTPMIGRRMRRYLARLKPLVAPLRETTAFKYVHRLAAHEITHPVLPPGLRDRLIDYYEVDNRKLADLIGHDLAPWLTSTRKNTA